MDVLPTRPAVLFALLHYREPHRFRFSSVYAKVSRVVSNQVVHDILAILLLYGIPCVYSSSRPDAFCSSYPKLRQRPPLGVVTLTLPDLKM